MSPTAESRHLPDRAARAKARTKLQEAIGQRTASDVLIKGWWSFLPLIAVAVGLVGLAAFALLISGLEGAVFGYVIMYSLGFAILAILTYRMTRRLSEHVRREAALRQGVIDCLRAAGEEAGREVAEELTSLEALERAAPVEERLPNQLYAAMAALPVVGIAIGFYYLHFLNDIPIPHDARWEAHMAKGSSAMAKLGLAPPSPTTRTARKRPFPLYFALSLLLFPFLGYWYHVLLKETNAHLEAQWIIEDQLLSALR